MLTTDTSLYQNVIQSLHLKYIEDIRIVEEKHDSISSSEMKNLSIMSARRFI